LKFTLLLQNKKIEQNGYASFTGLHFQAIKQYDLFIYWRQQHSNILTQ
jgi:hypothetical protein